MARKGGLGKGLDAILPPELAGELLGESGAGGRLKEIPVDAIAPNPHQPRLAIDEEALKRLADSIRREGVLQPVLVAPADGGFVLVAGERRWRAAKLAKIEKIPAIVLPQKPSEEQFLFLALVENLQREDLDPIEEAEAYRTLSERFGLTQEEIAQRVGKKRSTVANLIRLLKLPEEVKALLRRRKLTAGHAIVLLEERDPQRQIRLAKLAASRGLSVERLSVLVAGRKRTKQRAKKHKSAEILALEESLELALGTKVDISATKKKARLTIEFYSLEELRDFIMRLVAGESDGTG